MLPFQRTARRLMAALTLLSIAALCALPFVARAADLCLQYQGMMTRAAQAKYGPDAPVPMFMAQARQESSCRAGVTAWDDGRGLLQFMDGTSAQVSKLCPEIGPPNPYDPRWAIRAQQCYDGWLYWRVAGADECQKWGAALSSYNRGLGYTLQAQKASPEPKTWFGVTEYVPTRQSPKNFEYSRLYPRWILFKHQPMYVALGRFMCKGVA